MEKSNQKGIDIPIRKSLVILILTAGAWKETGEGTYLITYNEVSAGAQEKQHR